MWLGQLSPWWQSSSLSLSFRMNSNTVKLLVPLCTQLRYTAIHNSKLTTILKMKREIRGNASFERDIMNGPEHKRFKRSSSMTGMAAMTLLSLALRQKSSSPLHSSEESSPIVIPCDIEEINSTASATDAAVERSNSSSSYRSFDLECCVLNSDLMHTFKPMPLPPRLPNLPAGARADTFAM